MKPRLYFLLLMIFALTGAPFGMGRMMDRGHMNAHGAGHMATAHGESAPQHDRSTPHYMVCPAFAAACAPGLAYSVIFILAETPRLAAVTPLQGMQLLPPVPPPRMLS